VAGEVHEDDRTVAEEIVAAREGQDRGTVEFIVDRRTSFKRVANPAHRCAGSHLARMEIRVAIEEWLAAFPSFRLTDPEAVRWSAGQVRGPRVLPLDVR